MAVIQFSEEQLRKARLSVLETTTYFLRDVFSSLGRQPIPISDALTLNMLRIYESVYPRFGFKIIDHNEHELTVMFFPFPSIGGMWLGIRIDTDNDSETLRIMISNLDLQPPKTFIKINDYAVAAYFVVGPFASVDEAASRFLSALGDRYRSYLSSIFEEISRILMSG